MDWVGGTMGFRRRRGGGKGQAVARAVGLRGAKVAPRVIDLTAGLARDAFVLATLGCPVLAVERQTEIHDMVADGLAHAMQDVSTAEALGNRLQLLHDVALELLAFLAVNSQCVSRQYRIVPSVVPSKLEVEAALGKHYFFPLRPWRGLLRVWI